MSITDKTRKILWGRSGNRCAVCRQKLVVDETEMDAESVVGEECHIVSGSLQGPRYNPRFPLEEVDEIANLLLLCGTHHKMIDDQCETYSADVLRSIKTDHEKWVEAKLKDEALLPPVRIRRFKDNIPAQLRFIPTGQEIFSLVTSCEGMYYYHPDNLSVDKVELVGGFLQDLKDYADIASDFEPIDQIRASQSIDEDMKSLAEQGFYVFAAIEKQRIEGGMWPPSSWCVLHVSIAWASDPNVMLVSRKERATTKPASSEGHKPGSEA